MFNKIEIYEKKYTKKDAMEKLIFMVQSQELKIKEQNKKIKTLEFLREHPKGYHVYIDMGFMTRDIQLTDINGDIYFMNVANLGNVSNFKYCLKDNILFIKFNKEEQCIMKKYLIDFKNKKAIEIKGEKIKNIKWKKLKKGQSESSAALSNAINNIEV